MKILEVHPGLKIDAKKVADAWPAEFEKPTPRALTERLGKIRKDAGALIKSGTEAASNGAASAPVTPKKTKVKTEQDENAGVSGGKRKRPTPKKTNGARAKGDADTKVPKREVEELQAVTDRLTEATNAMDDEVPASNENVEVWSGDDGDDNGDVDEDRFGVGGDEADGEDEEYADYAAEELESPTKKLRVSAEPVNYEEMMAETEYDEDDDDE